MLYYVYFSEGGVPKAGLTPSWESLLTAENGTDKSGAAPAIAEVGGGYYHFDIKFAAAPWDVAGEDLVGVIDGGAALPDAERYKPIAISLRGLGLARIAHKAVQDKFTGEIEVFATDGVSGEMKLVMTDAAGTISRVPGVSGS